MDFSMFNPSQRPPKGSSAMGDISSPFLQPQLLTPIDPDAAFPASQPVIGSTLSDVVPDSQVRNAPNPFDEIVVMGPAHTRSGPAGAADRVDGLAAPMILPDVGMSDSTPRVKKDPGNPSGQSGGGIAGMLGRLLLGGSGDESSLDQATQKEKQSKRKSAGNASAAFANDPEGAAESFMKAPGTGGESFGSTLSAIAKMFSGL